MLIESKNQDVKDFDAQLQVWRLRIEDVLDRHLPLEQPTDLVGAGRYSLLGSGKRLRALLVLASAHDLGSDLEIATTGACAIEMVHAASLILDDMPCMDDALHRRGRDTTHLAYGQSTAILSAIGLISRAFELIGGDRRICPETRATMVETLAAAIGYAGLTGGQHDDLCASRGSNGSCDLKDLYTRKTGVLYSASLAFGGLTAGLTHREVEILSTAGKQLGIAFQLLDDLLDAVGTRDAVGKDVRQDGAKVTAISLYGIDGAFKEADRLTCEVRATIAGILGENATAGLVGRISDQALARMQVAGP